MPRAHAFAITLYSRQDHASACESLPRLPLSDDPEAVAMRLATETKHATDAEERAALYHQITDLLEKIHPRNVYQSEEWGAYNIRPELHALYLQATIGRAEALVEVGDVGGLESAIQMMGQAQQWAHFADNDRYGDLVSVYEAAQMLQEEYVSPARPLKVGKKKSKKVLPPTFSTPIDAASAHPRDKPHSTTTYPSSQKKKKGKGDAAAAAAAAAAEDDIDSLMEELGRF